MSFCNAIFYKVLAIFWKVLWCQLLTGLPSSDTLQSIKTVRFVNNLVTILARYFSFLLRVGFMFNAVYWWILLTRFIRFVFVQTCFCLLASQQWHSIFVKFYWTWQEGPPHLWLTSWRVKFIRMDILQKGGAFSFTFKTYYNNFAISYIKTEIIQSFVFMCITLFGNLL